MFDFIFFSFMIMIIFFSFMVIFADHPINALLFLIGSFIYTGFLLLLFGLDFLALVFIAVYVGAIAIFFLFIIMMMNLPSTYPKSWLFEEYIVLLLISLLFLNILYFLADNIFFLIYSTELFQEQFALFLHYKDILTALGFLLYTEYSLFVILSGFLLVGVMFFCILILQQKT